VSRSGAQIAGPGLGGLLVGLLGAPYALVLDAASFAVSAVLVLAIRAREPRPEPGAAPSMWRELREGLAYLVRHRYWRPLAVTTAAANFFWSMVGAVLLVYAVRELGMSPATIGLVLTLGGIGGLAGALFAPRIGRSLGVGATVVGASVLFGPPLLLVPLAAGATTIPVLVLSFTLSTAGATIYAITGLSLMQTLTPERLLGRMNASRRFIVFGAIPLGSLAGGTLASQLGLRPTIWIGAIGASACFLPIALSPVRRIGPMPNEPELDAASPGIPLPAAQLDA
jgi:predicted MFS family arabinose efflux permease